MSPRYRRDCACMETEEMVVKEFNLGAMAELDREHIHGRQREGIAIAKENGVYKGRKRIENKKFDSVYTEWKDGRITAVRAMELVGMARSTFYRRVAEIEKAVKK